VSWRLLGTQIVRGSEVWKAFATAWPTAYRVQNVTRRASCEARAVCVGRDEQRVGEAAEGLGGAIPGDIIG
jgi:hypothetical protein